MLISNSDQFSKGDIVSFYTDTLQELVGVYEAYEDGKHTFSKLYMLQIVQNESTDSIAPTAPSTGFQFVELQMYSGNDGHIYKFSHDKVISITKTHEAAKKAILARIEQ